jgi:hypothetical protein
MTPVEIVVPEAASAPVQQPASSFAAMRGLIGSVEGPEDWAAEHDHYFHGTPKRSF